MWIKMSHAPIMSSGLTKFDFTLNNKPIYDESDHQNPIPLNPESPKDRIDEQVQLNQAWTNFGENDNIINITTDQGRTGYTRCCCSSSNFI